LRVEGAGFRVQGSGCRVQGSGSRVQGAGCRVQGSGFRVQGAGLRVERFRGGLVFKAHRLASRSEGVKSMRVILCSERKTGSFCTSKITW